MPTTNPFLQPIRSAVDYSNDYATYDARRNQNALQAMTLEQAMQSNAAKGGVRNALAALGPDATLDKQIGALRSLGTPEALTQADTLETSQQNRVKTAAQAAKDNAEAAQTKQNTSIALHGQHLQALSAVQTPQDALQWMLDGVRSGALPESGLQQGLAKLQQAAADPQAFAQWKQGVAAAGMTVQQQMEMTAAKPAEMRLGNVVKTIDMNPRSPTFGKEVVGAQQIGLSPDTAYTQGQENARAAASRTAENTRAGATLAEATRHNTATEAQAAVNSKGQTLNEGQAKALGFGSRMREADKTLATLAAQGTTTPGLIKQGVESVPGIGGALAMGVNTLPSVLGGPSDAQQQVEQAQRDFVNAVLRRESGAAISPSEFQNAKRQYFDQPGDGPQVKAQKARNRQLAIQGVLAEVPATQRDSLSGPTGAAPATPAAPPAGFKITHIDGKPQ